MTLEQLKATAYDILVQIEQLQIKLRQVNQSIVENSNTAYNKLTDEEKSIK